MQTFQLMKNRRKTRFDVNHAIIFHVLQRFVRNALESFFRLHDTACVLKALQIKWQIPAVRVGLKPFGKIAGVVGRQFGVPRVLREIHDGLRTQSTVEMFMKQNLWKLPEVLRGEFHGLIKSYSIEPGREQAPWSRWRCLPAKHTHQDDG